MTNHGDQPEITVRDLTPADAALVSTWRYEGRWSIYNIDAADALTAERDYHAIVERTTDSLLGYVCFGAEARVPGLADESGVLDVGIGLDPAIVGRGRGRAIVLPVLRWIESGRDASELRAVIQTWNQRSVRLCVGLGFETAGHHQVLQAGSLVDYVIVRRFLR